jgi:acetyl-CoA C-acetyltransferase
MTPRKVAIVGVGQTHFESKKTETSEEIAFEAAHKALTDAGLTRDDLDGVVYGSAVDGFDGIHMKGEAMIAGVGGVGKAFARHSTGGATGVTAPIAAYWQIASGHSDMVLCICAEKMSPPRPHPQQIFRTIFDEFYERPFDINLLNGIACQARRYMHVHGITREQMAMVAVKNRRNAMKNPYAQLPGDFTVDMIMGSPVLVEPIHLMMMSPASDGGAAAIFTTEEKARELSNRPPVTVRGIGWCMDGPFWGSKDVAYSPQTVKSAKMAYKMAGITNPRKELDLAEVYDPVAYKELQHSEALGLCDIGEGGKAIERGDFDIDGPMPVNASGGLLGVGNPIAGAGMQKVISLVQQLRGDDIGYRVPGDLKLGLAHAWGGLLQFSSVMILGVD